MRGAGTYKNASDDRPCTSCFPFSTTERTGALRLLQCVCLPGYFSTGLLSENHSCAICGEGYFCPGGQQRFPCSPGSYTRPGIINYSSSCTLCEASFYKPTYGNGSCIPCPNKTESGAGAATCPCRAGFIGPDLGPCLCKATANRYLVLAVEGLGQVFSTKKVTLRVYNMSSGSPVLCGARGVYCEPFNVHFTLDGSEVNLTSPLACHGWRADECASQWGTGFEVGVVGANLVRSLVLKQGFHEDLCLEYGETVPEDDNLAAWSCNTVPEVTQLVEAFPDTPTVEIYSTDSSSAAPANVSADTVFWEDAHADTGADTAAANSCACSECDGTPPSSGSCESSCCSSGELRRGVLGVKLRYPRDDSGGTALQPCPAACLALARPGRTACVYRLPSLCVASKEMLRVQASCTTASARRPSRPTSTALPARPLPFSR